MRGWPGQATLATVSSCFPPFWPDCPLHFSVQCRDPSTGCEVAAKALLFGALRSWKHLELLEREAQVGSEGLPLPQPSAQAMCFFLPLKAGLPPCLPTCWHLRPPACEQVLRALEHPCIPRYLDYVEGDWGFALVQRQQGAALGRAALPLFCRPSATLLNHRAAHDLQQEQSAQGCSLQ